MEKRGHLYDIILERKMNSKIFNDSFPGFLNYGLFQCREILEPPEWRVAYLLYSSTCQCLLPS